MNPTTTSVAAQVAALPGMSTKELWALWDRYFPRRPENPNRDQLESRIAYKLQQAAFGGQSDDSRRRLENIGQRFSAIPQRRKSREIELAPGTVLLREWGEREHRVTGSPEAIAAVCQFIQRNGAPIDEASAVLAMHRLGNAWEQLYPAERHRIANLIIERVDQVTGGLKMKRRELGWKALICEFAADSIGAELIEVEHAT